MDGPGQRVSSSSSRRLGQTIHDRYRIEGVLGEGGTGTVFDAVRVQDGEPVALKVIHPALAGDRQIRGRFTREAAILRRLEGRHVCPVLDSGEAPDPAAPDVSLLYIAFPKVRGVSLERLLEEEPPRHERAVEIMLEVLAALSCAHGQGVVHRDLKPGNVLLEGGEHVFVVDFGMAKILTGGTGTTGLTMNNMVFGTPEYMSPEQARGDEPDARADVYAAGVLLYQLCTGSVPFRSRTALSVLTEHMTTPPESPRERARDRAISPALEAVILHALAKSPEHRYATAAAFAAALEHARAVPDDTEAIAPRRFLANPPGTDAFARTLPAVHETKNAPPPAVDGSFDTTLLAIQAPAGSSEPRPSDRARGTKRSAPPSSGARSVPAPARARPGRPWVQWAIWALLALASMGGGVYFALR